MKNKSQNSIYQKIFAQIRLIFIQKYSNIRMFQCTKFILLEFNLTQRPLEWNQTIQ